jgi:WD40 repeat protein
METNLLTLITQSTEQLTTYNKTIDSLNSQVNNLKQCEPEQLNEYIYSIESQIKLLYNLTTKQENILKLLSTINRVNLQNLYSQYSIKTTENIINMNNLHKAPITSLLQLTDQRILTGSIDGSLSICSINYTSNEYLQEIIYEQAHISKITYLCELPNNRFISCSQYNGIKIWEISQKEFVLIHLIGNHYAKVCKVIPLSEERFASCSEDKTIQIWSNKEPYNQLNIISQKGEVHSILQLQNNKNIIVASVWNGLNGCVNFISVPKGNIQKSINGVYTFYQNGMVELVNGHIVISNSKYPYNIVIVDSEKYIIIKEITNEEVITCYTSLCVLNYDSFIFLCDNNVIQVESKDYNVISVHKNEQALNVSAIIKVETGKYIIGANNNNGVFVMKYEI